MSQGVVTAYLVLAWSPSRWTTTPSSSGTIPRVGRSLRTSSSDQVPSVAASESSHDCRAARADLQRSGSSRILAPVTRRQVPGSIPAAIRQDALT